MSLSFDAWELGELTIRLVVALVLGGAIGLERQLRLRTAGIRTNALVSVGSALFVILGTAGIGEGSTADPTRIAAQVVSGIGFLGAGVILRDGLDIRGLTTAATLWCAAAVGSLSGAGLPLIALLGTAAIVATNVLLRPVSRLVNRRNRSAAEVTSVDLPCVFALEAVTSEKNEVRVRALIMQALDRPDLVLRSIVTRPSNSASVRVRAEVSGAPNASLELESAVQMMSLDHKVTSSRWWTVEQDG